jgi:hypothetical protein
MNFALERLKALRVGRLEPPADAPVETPRGDYWAQRATGLLAEEGDPDRKAELRELFEHRAGVCEYCGGFPRAEAERIAFEELQEAIRAAGMNPKKKLESN